MKQAPAIGFTCRVSWLLVATTLVVALLALVAVWMSGAPHWLRLALALLIILSAANALSRLLRPRIRSVTWRTDGSVEIVLRERTQEEGGPVSGVFRHARVLGPLIVLTLAWPSRGRAHLWLLPDNLDADTCRRLRMRLGAEIPAMVTSGNADSR